MEDWPCKQEVMNRHQASLVSLLDKTLKEGSFSI